MSFNKEQLEFAENYFFGDKKLYEQSDAMCQQWFVSYVQDKNSSSIREEVTLYHLGYQKLDNKHGADGYHPDTKKYVEVKPQYLHPNKKGKFGKLTGGGTFNDLTIDKIKMLEKEDWDILCSGFADDKMIFIARFSANDITNYLFDKLNKIIKKPKRRKSVSFGYNQYKDASNLKILWLDEDNAKKYMTKDMFSIFSKKYND